MQDYQFIYAHNVVILLLYIASEIYIRENLDFSSEIEGKSTMFGYKYMVYLLLSYLFFEILIFEIVND